MATLNANRLIEFLRKTVLYDGAAQTDGQLLNSFVHDKDNAALAALVRRHGPMVWGVCSRMLANPHDAEDAFQASFLVFVQKAPTLPDKETVGNWLYGVAHQTAVRMRALVAKRGAREKQVEVMPEATSSNQYVRNDLKAILDEELACLPDKYRTLIVLCDLEGKTRKEVARQLAIPAGTAASRLAAARSMLAKRLSRRGVVISGALLGGVLSSQAASPGVPITVIPATIKAVTLVAAGHAATTVISPTVAALTEGVVNAMFVTKFKSVLAGLLLVMAGMLTSGASIFVGGGLLAPQETQAAQQAAGQQAPASQQRTTEAGLSDHPAAADAGLEAGKRWKERATLRHSEAVICLALTKSNLATGGDRGDITVWDVKTGKAHYKSPDGFGHAGGVGWLACSADGLWLFSGGTTDGNQRTMDLTQEDLSKDCLRTGLSNQPGAQVIAHGPDPKTWVIANGNAVQVREWETPEIKVGKTAEEQPRPQVVAGYDHEDTVQTAAFSQDGALLATGGDDKTVRLWNIATNKQRAILRGHTDAVVFVALADGKHAASASKDGRVILWDVAAEKQTGLLKGERGIRCAAFSPGGRLLATGDDDGTVKIWDVANVRQIATLKGHKDAVRSLAFHPDGTILASGSQDRTVKLWQVDE